MIRKGFQMTVFSNCQEEYQKRHKEIWPEMVKMLRDHGVISYSIYLDKRNSTLFGYLEIKDEALWAKSSQTIECQKWWTYMKDVMETNQDHSPVVYDLEEVFHLDNSISSLDL